MWPLHFALRSQDQMSRAAFRPARTGSSETHQVVLELVHIEHSRSATQQGGMLQDGITRSSSFLKFTTYTPVVVYSTVATVHPSEIAGKSDFFVLFFQVSHGP